VINRGNYRRDVFAPRGSAEAFERCLWETCERFAWRLHAFVIMRNHFHLAVETPEPNLSVGMKHLQGTWANRFNRFHGEKGRPFQGRFKALPVEEGGALAQVANYIHLNPVRAKVASAERLDEFRWSSLWWYRQRRRPAFLEPAVFLAAAGGLGDSPAGWKRYLAYLAVVAEEDAKRREAQFGRLSRGWALGTREFRQSLIDDLRERRADLERARLPGAAAGDGQVFRAELWEQALERAAQAAGAVLSELGPAKSAPGKVLLAAVLKATSAVSNGWLCERLRMGTAASVSQFVRRFHQRGGAGRPEYAKAVAAARGVAREVPA
jgi:REP element-mobilizing transposase RayT